MLNVGVDFGSTYTTVSVYDEATETLETKLQTESGNPNIPSVVTISKNQVSIGNGAKNKILTGKEGIRTFRAFKMLLTESDQNRLEQRGFTGEYTPARVTSDFLKGLLGQLLADLGENKIDHLVVGVPEIWNSELSTIDGRAVLRDICREFPFVDRDGVQLVSEPAAASSFFAYNFRQITGQNYSGKILLIDYGGGTLDITLTDVEVRPDPNGREGMEIRVLYRTGAGENEEGQIGKAGVVYMESLMREAIRRTNPDQEIPTDTEFFRAVDYLEKQMQECTDDIKQVFDEYGTLPENLEKSQMNEWDYIFAKVPYQGNIAISHQLMVEVYNEVIQGVFRDKIKEVTDYMDEKGIDYMDRTNEKFKIVLVGGFGSFYLVQKQVADRFKFSSSDKRRENLIRKKDDRIKAISLGTALLSSGVIRIRNTAPYSIGVCVQDRNVISLTYGLYFNQDIEFNKVYLQRDARGDYVVILSLKGSIERFIINLRDDKRSALIVYPTPEIQKRLSQAITSAARTAVIGFSLDSSGIISLHVYDYDILTDHIGTETGVIELANFRELFDMQKVERAYKDDKI